MSQDDHSHPSILVRDDGHIIPFWSAHNGDTVYYRISLNLEDISSFGSERTLTQDNATYPSPIQLTGETDNPIYLFVNDRGAPTPGVQWRKSTDGGRTFSSAETVAEQPMDSY